MKKFGFVKCRRCKIWSSGGRKGTWALPWSPVECKVQLTVTNCKCKYEWFKAPDCRVLALPDHHGPSYTLPQNPQLIEINQPTYVAFRYSLCGVMDR